MNTFNTRPQALPPRQEMRLLLRGRRCHIWTHPCFPDSVMKQYWGPVPQKPAWSTQIRRLGVAILQVQHIWQERTGIWVLEERIWGTPLSLTPQVFQQHAVICYLLQLHQLPVPLFQAPDLFNTSYHLKIMTRQTRLFSALKLAAWPEQNLYQILCQTAQQGLNRDKHLLFVLHGDVKPQNILFGRTGLQGLVDWEDMRLGDWCEEYANYLLNIELSAWPPLLELLPQLYAQQGFETEALTQRLQGYWAQKAAELMRQSFHAQDRSAYCRVATKIRTQWHYWQHLT